VEANLELGLPIDSRRYDGGAQILTSLGVTTVRLMGLALGAAGEAAEQQNLRVRAQGLA
jgi:GTP cyclohydrolase II